MIETRRGLHFALARPTIELKTPLTIGTGGGDDTRDAICVKDANGLPALPGTSLAGVLRHALAGGGDPDRDLACRRLFGYQNGDLGDASTVEISWAQVHDQNNRPAPIRGAVLRDDSVLTLLAEGVLRDHVRISHRGVADGPGKFDESLVPAGARFTFELLVHATGDRDPMADLTQLLTLLVDPCLRVGGRTRRGYGVIEVKCAPRRSFDLRKAADRKAWLDMPRALEAGDPRHVLRDPTPPSAAGSAKVRATLTLSPTDHWIFGGGRPVREEHFRMDRGKRSEHAHERLPVTERHITWNGDAGAAAELPHLVPASGVKGALRHRVAFHARRLGQKWADPVGEGWPDLSSTPGYTQEEEWLFGKVKESADREEGDSAPGRVFLSDLYVLTVRYGALEHVSLDRFTQGPMDGLLFSEAPLYRGEPLELFLDIDTQRTGGEEPGVARKALAAALADLCAGRMALGAGGSKGHGYFQGGTVIWSDGGRWIGGGR